MTEKKEKGKAVFAVIEGIPGYETKVLLLQEKHKPLPRLWKLPGGTSENGEDVELTILREVAEETGIIVKPIAPEDIFLHKDCGKFCFVACRTRYYGGELRKGEEVEEFSFFSIDEVAAMINDGKIVPNHAAALAEYLKLGKGGV